MEMNFVDSVSLEHKIEFEGGINSNSPEYEEVCGRLLAIGCYKITQHKPSGAPLIQNVTFCHDDKDIKGDFWNKYNTAHNWRSFLELSDTKKVFKMFVQLFKNHIEYKGHGKDELIFGLSIRNYNRDNW